MRRSRAALLALVLGLFISPVASTQWWDGSYGYWDDSGWPRWGPMYWAEEMVSGQGAGRDWWRYGGNPWGRSAGIGGPWGSPWVGSPWGGGFWNRPWGYY